MANLLLPLLSIIYYISTVSAQLSPADCDLPTLSVKSRNLCRQQAMSATPTQTTPPPPPTMTTHENGGGPVPFYVTSTLDPFDVDDFDDMENFGNIPCENFTAAEIEQGVLCENASEPIIRWRDPVFEKLLSQFWNDYQVKIDRDSSLYGVGLEPMMVDPLIPGGRVDVQQEGALYQADLEMWDIQVQGLSTIELTQALVTRAEDLSDIELQVTFSFNKLRANGTYNLSGWFGWFKVDSDGPQAFDVEIINATLTPRIKLDTSDEYRNGCARDGSVLITDMGVPFKYDDISFNFNNIGNFYNTVVNGIGVFLIETGEESLIENLKNIIKNKVNSLIC